MVNKLFIIILGILFLATQVNAQGATINTLNPWLINGSTISTRDATKTITIPSLGGSGDRCIHTDNNGLLSIASADCGTGGGGGGADGNWVFNNTLGGFIRLATTTNRTGIGTTSPYAVLSVSSSAIGTTTLAIRPVASQTANILDLFSTTGVLDSVITAAGKWAIGTTTSTSKLSVKDTTTSDPTVPTVTIERGYTGSTPSRMATLLLRNRGEDTSGPDNYQNEVHLKLQTGTTNTYRRYIDFTGPDGVDDSVFGVNAENVGIWYDGNAVAHRMWIEDVDGPSYNSGDMRLSALGTGAVTINLPTIPGEGTANGTGGLKVYSGGTTVTSELNHTLNPSGYIFSKSGSNLYTMNQTGQVGIGIAPTNTTARQLELASSSATTVTSGDGLLALRNTNATLGSIASILFISNEGTLSRRSQISGGLDGTSGSKGFISFTTMDAAGTFYERAKLNGLGNFGIGTTSPYARLSVVGEAVAQYFTATSTTSTTTLAGGLSVAGSTGLTVKQDGKVGINTQSPTTAFQVNAGSSGYHDTLSLVANGVSGDSANLVWKNPGGTPLARFGADSTAGTDFFLSALGGMGFRTGSATIDGVDASQTMILDSSGNLGVGTSSPYARLSIAGQAVAGWVTATSTTQASTFPYASSTALTVSGALYNSSLSDGCLNVTSGLIGSTGSACGAGGGGTGDSVFSRNSTTNLIYHPTTTDSVVFGVTASSSPATLYIDNSNRRVGIGTSTPSNLLSIVGSSNLVDSSFSIGAYSANVLRSWEFTRKPYNATKNKYDLEISSNSYDGDILLMASSTYQGRVGIGTTSPYAKLSVVGETVANYFSATSTTASSTLPNIVATNLRLSGVLYDSANSAGTNGYVLQTDGTKATWVSTSSLNITGGSGSGTVGSGTTGQLPYYAGAGTTLTATSTLFLDTNSFLGINKTAPTERLHISGQNAGSASASTSIYIEQPAASVSARNKIVTGVTNGTDPYFAIETRQTNAPNNVVERLRITGTSGNVGIGTTTPIVAMDVYGGINSEQQTLATSTSMSIDFCTGLWNTNLLGVSSSNIAVTFTNANRCPGYMPTIIVQNPQSGTIGSTTFAAGTNSGYIMWAEGSFPGNSVVSGGFDDFCFQSIKPAASTTAIFIKAFLCGRY